MVIIKKLRTMFVKKPADAGNFFFVELTLGYKKNHPTGGVIFEIFLAKC